MIVAEARPKRSSLSLPDNDAASAAPERPLTPATVPLGAATALGMVIDTSGTMREVETERPKASVAGQVLALLEANPQITLVQLLDADGRFIADSANWLPVNAALRRKLRQALDECWTASNSNPLPGMIRFFGRVNSSPPPADKVALCVLGDELVDDDPESGLDRLERMNPVLPGGGRRVAIHAVIYPLPPGTGRMSASRLRGFLDKATATHGGSLVVLH